MDHGERIQVPDLESYQTEESSYKNLNHYYINGITSEVFPLTDETCSVHDFATLANAINAVQKKMAYMENATMKMCAELSYDIERLNEQLRSNSVLLERLGMLVTTVNTETKNTLDMNTLNVNSTIPLQKISPVTSNDLEDNYIKNNNSAVLGYSESWIPLFHHSVVLTTMWNKIVQDSDVKASWYTNKQHSELEKQDPIFADALRLLNLQIGVAPDLALSDFLVTNMNIITSWQGIMSKNLPSDLPIDTSLSDIIANYKIKNGQESISTIWEEFYLGLDGQPSIHELEKKYGTKWRGGSHSTISKALTRRKCVYRFIVYGMKQHSMDPNAIIEWLDEFRNRGRKKFKRANITWFAENYHEAVRDLYNCESLGFVNLKDI